MPYLSPSPSLSHSHSPSSPTAPPADNRLSEPLNDTTTTHHRRIRSAGPSFSDEKGPGAFAPLGRLPRRQRQRQDKKPLFEIAPDDSEYDHHDSWDSSPPLTTPTPPILTSARGSPPVLVTSAASPPAVSHIPFPTSSPVVSAPAVDADADADADD